MLNRLLAVTILGGLLPLGAKHSWLLELTSHFRLQYLAIALVPLLAAIALRRRVLALLLVAVMAVNAWPVLAYLPGRVMPVGGEPVSILNLNVNSGNGDHQRTLDAIRAAQAEVVTLIELSPALEDALGALSRDYPYRFMLAADDNFGIGVLSRYPIAYAEPRALGPGEAIVADIDHPAGRFRLFAVHALAPMSKAMAETRNRQLDALARMARETAGPLVVCGDFNLTPYSPWFRRFEALSGMRDVRRGTWPGISWPSFMPVFGIPIDHCFTREPFVAEAVERLGRTGSDHYPVRVGLIR